MNVSSNYVLPPLHFDNETYTLKEFLENLDDSKYRLPFIVNIVALNNYGRSIKNILTKNTPLVLLEIDQLDSVIADYYNSSDGRSHSQRNRLPLSHSRMVTKSTAKIRNIKKFSKSVANLSSSNHNDDTKRNGYPDNDDDDEDDENAYNLRAFVKLLNEKRSSSVSLCRIPAQYRSFFELLNADDESIAPYTKLSDLPGSESDHEESDKRTEKTPVCIFLRRACNAYTKKETSDSLRLTTTDHNSNLTTSVDSCYGSSSDLASFKNAIILNEIPEILPAGQTIALIDNCYAHRTPVSNKEPEQHLPSSPSSPHFSPVSWMRATTKLFSSKKHRNSGASASPLNENKPQKVTLDTFELYMRCRTKDGHIVYIAVDEPILFSPLTRDIQDSKTKASFNYIDTSDVFKIKDLLSNFRFPINVRLLEGPLSFDNSYAPAFINQEDDSRLVPTKFRLLGSHNERVIFVCPLNKAALKYSKSPISYILIPLSVNADIEIQLVTNMNQITKSVGFKRITEECSKIIKYYQTEITFVHFPLSLMVDMNQNKQALYKKRSQSESYADCCEEDLDPQYRHPAQELNDHRQRRRHSDEASFLTAHSLHNRDSNDTIEEKPSTETAKQEITHQRSSQHVRFKDERKKRHSQDVDPTVENQMYEDVDKIYDYIRTGNTTDKVKELVTAKQHYDDIPTSSTTAKKSNPFSSLTCPSPGNTITYHRSSPKVIDSHRKLQPCDGGDGNVDNEQARALYMAAKQRTKAQSQQDLSRSIPITKAKRISKH